MKKAAEKVLCYHFDEETLEAVRAVMRRLGVECRALPAESFEQSLLQQICLREVLQKLAPDEREMLFLRYINDVPVPVMSRLYSISRFAMYRKLKSILKKMRSEMEKEGRNG